MGTRHDSFGVRRSCLPEAGGPPLLPRNHTRPLCRITEVTNTSPQKREQAPALQMARRQFLGFLANFLLDPHVTLSSTIGRARGTSVTSAERKQWHIPSNKWHQCRASACAPFSS